MEKSLLTMFRSWERVGFALSNLHADCNLISATTPSGIDWNILMLSVLWMFLLRSIDKQDRGKEIQLSLWAIVHFPYICVFNVLVWTMWPKIKEIIRGSPILFNHLTFCKVADFPTSSWNIYIYFFYQWGWRLVYWILAA